METTTHATHHPPGPHSPADITTHGYKHEVTPHLPTSTRTRSFSLSPFQEDINRSMSTSHKHEYTTHGQHAEYLQQQAFLQIQSPSLYVLSPSSLISIFVSPHPSYFFFVDAPTHIIFVNRTFPIISESISRRRMVLTNVIAAPIMRYKTNIAREGKDGNSSMVESLMFI